MSFTVIIPARYASQRLPGKPLRMIAGKPMIEHVYDCAKKSLAENVIVATDDQRIFDAVNSFGGEVCMTSENHESGTDRLQEVARLKQLPDDHIVVNVQGDEPLIPAEVINQVATNLSANLNASAATLSEPVASIADVANPNIVKVVSDVSGMALYFSRASIPWGRETYSSDIFSEAKSDVAPVSLAYRHIGIYAYRVSLLNQFVKWPMADLEAIERLEQLRILSHGHKIHVEPACMDVPGGVDTEEDLTNIQKLFEKS